MESCAYSLRPNLVLKAVSEVPLDRSNSLSYADIHKCSSMMHGQRLPLDLGGPLFFINHTNFNYLHMYDASGDHRTHLTSHTRKNHHMYTLIQSCQFTDNSLKYLVTRPSCPALATIAMIILKTFCRSNLLCKRLSLPKLWIDQ